MGRQLATRIQPEWARLGVDGHYMSDAETEERLAHLNSCRELFNELNGADISEQQEILERANALFSTLGCESDDVDRKMEAFLCITYSGLLFICIDKVLRVIEDWDLRQSRGIVLGSAADFARSRAYLEGARSVTLENQQRCQAFVDIEMPEDQRFDGGYDTFKVNEVELFEKWEAFLELGCNPTRYFSEYYVCHAVIKFATPLVEEVSQDLAADVSLTLKALMAAFKQMLSEYDPDVEVSESDGDNEMNHSD